MIESINLNLIPSGVSPVCHVSQYDAGRQIKINLFEGINPYTIQSGDAFTLNVRKPDNTIVTTSVSGTQGDNHITISTTEQIAAVVGENLCELKITNGSTVIGTLNFIMIVERDVLADGIPSQSVIEDLDERIAEAIGDNYYNKTETDALLALKADKSELYNAYPTEQESGAIASFTDGADNIPVKSLVSEIVAVQSGSGTPSPSNPRAISGFDNGVVSVCGKNLLDYNAWKSSTATTARATTVFQNNGVSVTATANDGYVFPSFRIPCVGGETYILSWNSETNIQGLVYVFFDNNTFLYVQNGTQKLTFTVPIGTNGVKLRFGVTPSGQTINYSNIQIELGDTATTYEAYNGNTYTFAFGQTVYGGHFDNKGNLVVTHNIIDMGSIDWNELTTEGHKVFGYRISDKAENFNFICSTYNVVEKARYDLLDKEMGVYNLSNAMNYVIVYDTDYSTASDFKVAMNGQKIVYELANPITLAITSQDIPTLLGENNIFSNTGDVEVTIRADIGLYIDKRLNANRSTPNNLSRAAAYVDEPESVNETQENNVEPQNEER